MVSRYFSIIDSVLMDHAHNKSRQKCGREKPHLGENFNFSSSSFSIYMAHCPDVTGWVYTLDYILILLFLDELFYHFY